MTQLTSGMSTPLNHDSNSSLVNTNTALRKYSTLQRHNTENLKQIFTEKELRGLGSQFPHSCDCERFIYSHDLSTYSAAGKYVDRSWNIYSKSVLDSIPASPDTVEAEGGRLVQC
jgi:hypothetical protein